MKSGKQRVQWSAEKFASVAKAQRQSKLSVQAFCRREGINLSSFYRWQSVLSSRGGELVSAEPSQARCVAGSSPVSGEFIELGSMAAAPRVELRFDFGNGVSLTVTR